MEFRDYNSKELENALLDGLNATEEMLAKWEKDDYLMDSDVVSKVWRYINNAPAVVVFGDYDADGINGLYIMGKGIKAVCPDKKLILRAPKRFSEGYGITMKAAEELNAKIPKGSLIITVDNGIAAAEVLEWLEAQGHTVIVTDHHDFEVKEGKHIPNITMVLDPAVPETSLGFSYKKWCGAAIAFKLCEQLISDELKKELEVFAGVATVADCVELKEGNWGLVRRAITAIREGKAPNSLNAIMIAMKQNPMVADEDTIGYYIGPCFNAAGRLEDSGASEVLKYLFSPTEDKLEHLISMNTKRKAYSEEEYARVRDTIHAQSKENACPIWVYVPELHEGLVGILAGRAVEEFKVPAIVVTDSAKSPGMYKGSGRSVDGFHLFNFVNEFSEDFEKMGGHAGAIGLTISPEGLERASKHQILKSELQSVIEESNSYHIEPYMIPEINRILYKYKPYGEGNKAPVFSLDIDRVKEGAKMFKNKSDEANPDVSQVREHLIINGYTEGGEHYQITHWNHTPNDLENQKVFGLSGKIFSSSYGGEEIPTFNADETYDIVRNARDKDVRTTEYDPREEEIGKGK